ncbi:MAG: hypothetical protein H6739_19190 [Alphaproteobacteria bacterium]|nr:hypothetical protein [Alphaproteobacteria bacterium]
MPARPLSSVGQALLLGALVASGCVITPGGKDRDGTDDTADTADGGGGNNLQWRPAGRGKAYLLDGEQDHSLFTLEVTRTAPPDDGDAYYGFLLGGDSGTLALGEIEVQGDQVVFEHELGVNAFLAGYNRFEAYAHDAVPSGPGEGTPLWEGAFSEDAARILEELLVSSPEAPNGEGSLRAIETTVETIRDYGLDGLETLDNVQVLQNRGEAMANGIKNEELDHNSDGTVSTIGGLTVGLVGDSGQVEIILDDLTEAFNAFGGQSADDDVRGALDDAYDCVENIERHVESAYSTAGTVTVCGAASSCQGLLQDAADDLQLVLDGQDVNEDGAIDDSEGTVECAIDHVSRLMAFDVATP